MARTAVVAGTATAVSNRVSRRQAERWSNQGDDQYYSQAGRANTPQPEQQYAEPAPAAPAAPDPIEQLKQLGQLHEQGILTDEEFAAQKAKILG
jgi:hypothetical protein